MLYRRKGSKIWRVRIKRNYLERPIDRSARTEKKSEAAKLERQILTELEQYEKGQVYGRKYKFNEALVRWVNSNPPDSWLPKIEQIMPYFDDSVLLVDAPKVANKMKSELIKQDLKPTTINRRLAVIRRVLNLAFDEYDMIDQPLSRKIKLLSEKGTARQVYLTREQFNAIFAAIKPERKTANTVHTKAGLLLLVFTGMRKSEALRATPDDWRPPNLIVKKTKNGKPRAVPVDPVVHFICDTMLPIDCTAGQLRYWWEKARKQTNMEHVTMHDLRHTFASWYADDPQSTLLQLRDMLGHSNFSVTSKYTHLMSGSELPDGFADGIDTTVH